MMCGGELIGGFAMGFFTAIVALVGLWALSNKLEELIDEREREKPKKM